VELSGKPRSAQELAAKELFEKHGDGLRKYRNTLGLAIQSSEQIEILRRSVRYLMAADNLI